MVVPGAWCGSSLWLRERRAPVRHTNSNRADCCCSSSRAQHCGANYHSVLQKWCHWSPFLQIVVDLAPSSKFRWPMFSQGTWIHCLLPACDRKTVKWVRLGLLPCTSFLRLAWTSLARPFLIGFTTDGWEVKGWLWFWIPAVYWVTGKSILGLNFIRLAGITTACLSRVKGEEVAASSWRWLRSTYCLTWK